MKPYPIVLVVMSKRCFTLGAKRAMHVIHILYAYNAYKVLILLAIPHCSNQSCENVGNIEISRKIRVPDEPPRLRLNLLTTFPLVIY